MGLKDVHEGKMGRAMKELTKLNAYEGELVGRILRTVTLLKNTRARISALRRRLNQLEDEQVRGAQDTERELDRLRGEKGS